MGLYKIIRYSFSCESMELLFEDEGKGREITNHCHGSDEYLDKEEGQRCGWKIISEDEDLNDGVVLCPYCSRPENMTYLEKFLGEK